MKTQVFSLLLVASLALGGEAASLKERCVKIGISGRVLNAATGKPVTGAKVCCTYQFMTSGLATRIPGEAMTDADGRFAIPSRYEKSKYRYGVTDDPTNPDAWKPDVPSALVIEHPNFKYFVHEFPTKRQNAKVPYLRQRYPIFTDGADYRIQPK